MKQNKTKLMKNAFGYAVIILSVLAFCFIFRHVLYGEKGYYHSDCTDSILWSQATYESGKLINPDFNYAGIIPVGGNLIMLPFVALFGVTIKAQVCGMAFFFLLFLGALILFFKSTGFSLKATLGSAALIIFVASSSEKLREIFWGHIIYYSLGLFFLLVGLAIICLLLNREDRTIKSNIKLYIALFLWTLICSINGIQSLTMFSLPVIAAIVAERFFDVDTPIKSKVNYCRGIIIAVVFVGVLVGLIIGKIIIGDVSSGYAEGYSKFSESNEWMNNLWMFFPEFFTLIGVKIENDMLIYSFGGVCNLLRIIAGIVLIAVPVIMLFFYKRIKEAWVKIVLLTHHFLTALLLLGWVFGRLNSANWRLTPFVISATIISIIFVRWAMHNLTVKRGLSIIVIPVMLLTLITFMNMVTMDKQSYYNKEITKLVDYLEKNELEYGYASFWNANISTLMSDSKVKIRDINMDETGYCERMYQSNVKWYDDNKHDKYFVVLSEDEYIDYYVDNSVFEEADDVLGCGIFTILVYDENIFSKEDY